MSVSSMNYFRYSETSDGNREWTYRMESELIKLVKNYPSLWNSSEGRISRILDRKQIWHLLTIEMKCRFPQNRSMFTIAHIKAKFHRLKQNYLRMLQDDSKHLPCRKSMGHYDELSFLKMPYGKERVDLTEPRGLYVRCDDQGVTMPIQGSLEKPEDGVSCSADFSKFQPIISRRESSPPPMSFSPTSNSQLVMLSNANPEPQEQQTVPENLSECRLDNHSLQLQMKPQSVKTYLKPNVRVLPKQITRNWNENCNITPEQTKQEARKFSSLTLSSSRLKDKLESNGKMWGKRHWESNNPGMVLKSNASSKLRSPISPLVKPALSFKSQFNQEPLSPESSHEKSIGSENSVIGIDILEESMFSVDSGELMSKAQNEHEPVLRKYVSETEDGGTAGIKPFPTIESLESCVCRCRYEDSNPNSEHQIQNKSTPFQELDIQIQDANSSRFYVYEENNETTHQANSDLRAVEIVSSPENLKLDDRLDLFGKFVSASLKSFSWDSREKMMLQICNMLLNPNI